MKDCLEDPYRGRCRLGTCDSREACGNCCSCVGSCLDDAGPAPEPTNDSDDVAYYRSESP